MYPSGEILQELDHMLSHIMKLKEIVGGPHTHEPVEPAPTPPPAPVPEPTPEVPTPTPSSQLLTADKLRSAFRGYWIPERGKSDTVDYRRTTRSEGEVSFNSNGDVILNNHPYDVLGVSVQRSPDILSKDKDIESLPHGEFVGFYEFPDPGNMPFNNGTKMHGFLSTEKGLFYAFKRMYSVVHEDAATQGRVNDDDVTAPPLKLLATDSVNCPHPHHNLVGGHMCLPPKSLRDKYDYLVGLGGASGMQHSSWGPCLWAVDYNAGKAQPLVCYPKDHPSNSFRTTLGLPQMARCRGAAWIDLPNVQGVAFAYMVGTGNVWYGEQRHIVTQNIVDKYGVPQDLLGTELYDPFNTPKGYHAEGRTLELWIYDPNDIMKVYNGQVMSWEIEPVHIIKLDEYILSETNSAPSIAYDGKGRLLISVAEQYQETRYEKHPLFMEFDLAGV